MYPAYHPSDSHRNKPSSYSRFVLYEKPPDRWISTFLRVRRKRGDEREKHNNDTKQPSLSHCSIILYYTIIFKIITPINPTTDTIVSMIDHEQIVSFMLRLKYSLNIQKPESLTCENIKLPAPKDKTIKFGFAPVCVTKGITTPAAVNAATVADPTHNGSRQRSTNPRSTDERAIAPDLSPAHCLPRYPP